MSGGGKGGSQITGYRYFMGMHVVPCRGPVDSVNSLIFGERVAWSGSVTSTQQIHVDAYELFGGESREGGVRGYVDVMMGDEAQGINSYLEVVCNGGTTSNVSSGSFLTALEIRTASSSTTLTGATQLVYTMTATPDNSGNVTYTVTKTTSNASGQSVTEQLISTTYPSNENAETDANAVFVRTSETTSSTDGSTGITTTQTIIQITTVPGYRGLLSLVFKNFMFAAVNPYFKNLWIDVTRVLKGWHNDSCWYPAKAKVGSYDMNPAHIIYQAMTDPEWGMGESVSDFDDTVWRTAADQLYAEGFGLSMRWTKSSSIENFIQQICDHINAVVRLNIKTGLFELKLIRDDYTLSSITELNVDNIVILDSFERAAWGELCSQVIVNYTTRDDQATSITVQDGAAIRAQGGVVAASKDYPFIREPGIALRVAQRDLQIMSSPLAKVSLKCNRILWDHDVGDVFRLNWSPLNITDVVFRITKIDKGNIRSGIITVEAIEDVFALPDSSYAAVQTSKWVDPNQDAHGVANYKLVESTYWDVIRNTSAANFNALPSDFAFTQVLAKYGTGTSSSFKLYGATSDVTANYSMLNGGHYSPRALLSVALGYTDTTASFVGASGFDSGVVGSYAYIDDECVVIDAINTANGKLTIRRGVLDTVPTKHVVGAPIWVAASQGYDQTTREAGETMWYRVLPITSNGTLALGGATGISLALKGRAEMPYPPGQFKVNGQYYPDVAYGALVLSWAHRDRTQQTVTLNDYTYGNVGPETGVTYTVELWTLAGVRVRQVTGLTGTSWTYASDMSTADGNMTSLVIKLYAVRGGLNSWQSHSLRVDRGGLGLALGEGLGGAPIGTVYSTLLN